MSGLGQALARIFGMDRVRLSRGAVKAKRPETPIERERRLDRKALAKAKRIAAKHGHTIRRDREGWWVLSVLTDTPEDPIAGNAFCTSGREVLETVEAVAAAMKGQSAGVRS